MSSFFDEVRRAETKLFSIRACRISQRLLTSGWSMIRSRKAKARRGRRCAGLLILTDNWEEECCQSNRATLGGGVRRFDDLNIALLKKLNRASLAMQQCIIAWLSNDCLVFHHILIC
jgi:hypothetical protein